MENNKKDDKKTKELMQEGQYPHKKTQEQKSLNNSRKSLRTGRH